MTGPFQACRPVSLVTRAGCEGFVYHLFLVVLVVVMVSDVTACDTAFWVGWSVVLQQL